MCLLLSLIWVAAVLLIISLTISFSFAGLVLYRRFIGKRLIDPKKNIKRNYSRLLLGESDAKICLDDNTLDLRGYCRNAYTDILLAERYYSFLASDGYIEIHGVDSKYYNDSNKISSKDYLLLHPVTLLENGISTNKRKYVLLNPIVGIVFLVSMLKNLFLKKHVTDEKIFNVLILFCESRNICLKIC